MKKSLILLGMLSIGYAYAQQGNVGINTQTPQATLDIQPNVENAKIDATTNQGIIIPKLSKARVVAIADKSLVEGTKVYVTDEVTATDTKFIGIGKGFYFYNGEKWVKQLSSDTELWAQRDNNGVTETYLKPANEKTDFVGYRSDRRFSVNLGNLADTTFDLSNDLKGFSTTEVPFSTVITSDVFSNTSTIGENKKDFIFSGENFLITQNHASKNTKSQYLGKQAYTLVKDLTSPVGLVLGLNSSVDVLSNGSIDTLTGIRAFTGAVSTTEAKIGTHTAGEFIARNSGTSETMIGINTSVRNTGIVSALRGVMSTIRTQEPVNGQVPAHTVGSTIGLHSSTELSNNATLVNGSLIGIFNSSTIGENVTADARDITGIHNTMSTHSSLNTNIYGIRNLINLSNAKSSVNNMYITQSTVFSTGGEGVSVKENVVGYHFKDQSLEGGDSKNWTTNKQYGILFDPIVKGTSENYGIYLGNVGNTTTNNTNKSFAIYTNSGKVRFGDNVGVGVDTPNEKLEVAGAIKVATTTSTCTTANRGTIKFENDNFYGCKSTGWVQLNN